MKLIITKPEMLNAVRRFYNVPFDTEVTIEDEISVKNENPMDELISEIDKINPSSPSKKIMAIRQFRTRTGVSLTEGKWSIENWYKVRNWLFNNKRTPKYKGTYPDFTLE